MVGSAPLVSSNTVRTSAEYEEVISSFHVCRFSTPSPTLTCLISVYLANTSTVGIYMDLEDFVVPNILKLWILVKTKTEPCREYEGTVCTKYPFYVKDLRSTNHRNSITTKKDVPGRVG